MGHEGAGEVVEVGSAVRDMAPGDHVIVSDSVYGGTYRIGKMLLENFGLKFDFVIEPTQARFVMPTCPRDLDCVVEQAANINQLKFLSRRFARKSLNPAHRRRGILRGDLLIADRIDDFASLDRQHAGQRLHQLGLSVALHAAKADNLARMKVEAATVHCDRAVVAMDDQFLDRQR